MKRVLWFLILVVLGCTDDNPVTPINDEFIVYIERFVDEANKRGIKRIPPEVFDKAIENLRIDFDEELTYYCGYATSSDPNNPRVIISTDANCWKSRSDADKEILIFHELGHAILRRAHLNSKLPNGDYKSMMFNGNQFGLYEMGSERRTYYIDELFDLNTSIPDWAN